MLKKIFFLILLILMMLFFFVFFVRSQEKAQMGMLSVYFMEEKVGYEEYIWESDERGYILSVKGRMTKPTPMEIEKLTICLDKNFIPNHFYFIGSVSGVAQEVSSSIKEGDVKNRIRVAGQERENTVKIKRDAFLLPNPIFSPYLVLTKKFRCALETIEEKVELSAYIIPQFEVSFTLEPKEGEPCSLFMELNGIQIELPTDDEGDLRAIYIPSQKLKVIQGSS